MEVGHKGEVLCTDEAQCLIHYNSASNREMVLGLGSKEASGL